MSASKELLVAEKFYVSQLKVCRPVLDAARDAEFFRSAAFSTFFEEFANVEKSSYEFQAQLEKAAEAGDIASAFISSKAHFEILGKYVALSEEWLNAIRNQKSKNDEVAEFLAEITEKVDGTEHCGTGLQILLASPIAAITRYKYFLNVIKTTDESKDAAGALDVITETLNRIAGDLKKARGQRELAELDKLFEGKIKIYSPARFLDVRMQAIVKHAGIFTDMEMFIFSDYLVLATFTGIKSTPFRLQYDYSLKDSSLQIVDVPDGDKLADDGAETKEILYNADDAFGGFGFGGAADDPEEDRNYFKDNIHLISGPKKHYIHCKSSEEKARVLTLLRRYHGACTGAPALA